MYMTFTHPASQRRNEMWTVGYSCNTEEHCQLCPKQRAYVFIFTVKYLKSGTWAMNLFLIMFHETLLSTQVDPVWAREWLQNWLAGWLSDCIVLVSRGFQFVFFKAFFRINCYKLYANGYENSENTANSQTGECPPLWVCACRFVWMLCVNVIESKY